MDSNNAQHISLLFFVTEDWYFCSHRLDLAKAAIALGWRVTVVTRVRHHGAMIRDQGIRLIPLEISRQNLNPISELVLLAKIYRIYRRECPYIVHQVALKPVLYGSFIARLTGVPKVVNALAGLGFLFSSKRLLARLLKPLVQFALKLLLVGHNNRLILQNPDDMSLIKNLVNFPSHRMYLIHGAGVNLTLFHPAPIASTQPDMPIILFPARLLWDKGLGELVAAARLLRARGVLARCVLVGAPDFANPTAVPESQIQSWVNENLVEWWGQRDDMPEVLQQSHIVCLPSYREGLPKALAEAAACGLPIVTTDVPGCREVVRHGHNGLLVPPHDSLALAEALAKLILEPELRAAYGQAGRRRAEATFGSTQVIAATLAVYTAHDYS